MDHLSVPAGLKSTPTALPATLRQQYETSFGTDLSNIRIHESHAATLLGRAFSEGSDIHFVPGAYQPFTDDGSKLLGHELAHVVQQAGGRVAVQAESVIESVISEGAAAAGDGSI